MHLREFFENSRHPFLITVAGEQLCIITSAEDISAVYKNVESFTFDTFVRDVMVAFGASPSAVDKMWLFPSKNGHGFTATVPNPSNKCLAQLTRDFHKQQLHPGDHHRELSDKFLFYIDGSLNWECISAEIVIDDDGFLKRISLKKWCRDVLLQAATKAFFGESLLEIQPDLLNNFFNFDDNSWMLMYRFPRFLAKTMYRAKEAAIDGLERYFKTQKECRNDAAWFVQTLETEQRRLGIGERDIATSMLMVYWV